MVRIGEVRDKGLRERAQIIAVANNEALRVRRKAGKYAYSKLHPPAKAVIGELVVELELKDKVGKSMSIQPSQVNARIIGKACSPAIVSEKQPAVCCLPKPEGWYTVAFVCSASQELQVVLTLGEVELAPLKVTVGTVT